MIRRQLPAYSPLSLGGILGAALEAGRRGRDVLEDLREHLAAWLGADRVLLTDSGTHALQAALTRVARARPNRPVALPAYTCYDVATAALGAGVPVLFYDVDPRDLTPDPVGVARCLDEGAAAVVANSLYGFPLDWPALQARCAEKDAVLVEDGAQGTGAGWAGRPSGSFGDLSVLSFGRGKGWTGGSGGALLARGSLGDEMLAAAGEDLEAAGEGGAGDLARCLAQWLLGRPGLFGIPHAVPGLALGETRYHPPSPVAGMSRYAASSVLRHREASLAEAPVRREWAGMWRRLLEEVEGASGEIRVCDPVDEASCGYLRLPLVASGRALEALDSPEAGRAGVAAGYPKALPGLVVLEPAAVGGGGVPPGARELASGLRTLPTHSLVTASDLARARSILES